MSKNKKIGVSFPVEESITYADDSVVSQTLLNKDTGTITLFTFDAGQGQSEHTAPFDAVARIPDGQARISTGGNSHTVDKGEMIIMHADTPHTLHAEQRFKMLLTMIRGE
jgi:quercetin dioxygenase-like cupin family protein